MRQNYRNIHIHKNEKLSQQEKENKITDIHIYFTTRQYSNIHIETKIIHFILILTTKKDKTQIIHKWRTKIEFIILINNEIVITT